MGTLSHSHTPRAAKQKQQQLFQTHNNIRQQHHGSGKGTGIKQHQRGDCHASLTAKKTARTRKPDQQPSETCSFSLGIRRAVTDFEALKLMQILKYITVKGTQTTSELLQQAMAQLSI